MNEKFDLLQWHILIRVYTVSAHPHLNICYSELVEAAAYRTMVLLCHSTHSLPHTPHYPREDHQSSNVVQAHLGCLFVPLEQTNKAGEDSIEGDRGMKIWTASILS